MPERSKKCGSPTAVPSAEEYENNFVNRLGPGLITGAADDDPSGIATYSQVGAQFGFSMLWTMLFTFPLMAAIQEICARLGRITGVGIAGNLRKCYPRSAVYGVIVMLGIANVFNLGADISAMAAAAQLLFGGIPSLYAVLFGALSLVLQIFFPYRRYVGYLRFLTWSLFAYVATAFVVHVPWPTVLRSAVIPSISLQSTYLMALVGVLGTTISPYLFFWQTSQEAEEVRIDKKEAPLKKEPYRALMQFRRIALDTRIGMALSNLVAFFIILTTAVTLHTSGNSVAIRSSADAARALQPLAGNLAFSLFAGGIVGTGMLAVPVLAGSTAYAVSEAFRWRASLERKPQDASKFYLVLSGATITGILLNFLGIDPMRSLFLSAVVNGVVAAPLMIMIMLMSEKKLIVRQFRLPPHLKIGGWVGACIMLLASLFFLFSALLRL